MISYFNSYSKFEHMFYKKFPSFFGRNCASGAKKTKMRLGLTQVSKHVENRPLLRPARRGKTRSLRTVLQRYVRINSHVQ